MVVLWLSRTQWAAGWDRWAQVGWGGGVRGGVAASVVGGAELKEVKMGAGHPPKEDGLL